MSYTAHEWTDGETITAAKLNNIEEGINEASQSGGGGLTLIPWTFDPTGSINLGMTCQEILDGMLAGNLYAIYLQQELIDGWSVIDGVSVFFDIENGASYGNGINVVSNHYTAYAQSMSDYPSIYIGD